MTRVVIYWHRPPLFKTRSVARSEHPIVSIHASCCTIPPTFPSPRDGPLPPPQGGRGYISIPRSTPLEGEGWGGVRREAISRLRISKLTRNCCRKCRTPWNSRHRITTMKSEALFWQMVAQCDTIAAGSLPDDAKEEACLSLFPAHVDKIAYGRVGQPNAPLRFFADMVVLREMISGTLRERNIFSFPMLQLVDRWIRGNDHRRAVAPAKIPAATTSPTLPQPTPSTDKEAPAPPAD